MRFLTLHFQLVCVFFNEIIQSPVLDAAVLSVDLWQQVLTETLRTRLSNMSTPHTTLCFVHRRPFLQMTQWPPDWTQCCGLCLFYYIRPPSFLSTDVDLLCRIWSVLWRESTKALCTFQEKQLDPWYLFNRLVSFLSVLFLFPSFCLPSHSLPSCF